MQAYQNVDVVFDPSDVPVEFLAMSGPQDALAILGRKNDLIQDLRECGHLRA